MLQRLYRLLLPRALREKIYQANAQRYEAERQATLYLADELIPAAQLTAAYIENLKIVPDPDALLKQMPKNAVVAELGVGRGDFSWHILAVTKPQHLHLLAVPYGGFSAEEQATLLENKFRTEVEAGQVIIHSGNPTTKITAMNDGSVDWLYIDSLHSFDAVTTLLNACAAKVKEHGFIVGRNYTNRYLPVREQFGVVDAVNRFCKQSGWEMVYLTHEAHRNLTYAIRRMPR